MRMAVIVVSLHLMVGTACKLYWGCMCWYSRNSRIGRGQNYLEWLCCTWQHATLVYDMCTLNWLVTAWLLPRIFLQRVVYDYQLPGACE
jgi:hypothetical protein